MTRRIAPYGTWESPISALSVAGNSKRFGSLLIEESNVYWSEGRPDEAGRTVIVKCDGDGQKTDLISAPFCARSRVHEYGGGEFSVWKGRVFFVNDQDQDVYEILQDGEVNRLTNQVDWRFSDMCFDHRGNRLIAVAERHNFGERLPVNLLVSISLSQESLGEISVIAKGRDFYASPRISSCGLKLAYLVWDLPHMPWEAAELWIAERREIEGFPSGEKVVGGEGSSVFQPEWRGDGSLVFVWDKSGWGNLYLLPAGCSGGESEPLFTDAAEFAHPQWVFGMRSFALAGDDKLIVRYFKSGTCYLGLLDIPSRSLSPLEASIEGLAGIDAITANERSAYIIGTFHHLPPAILKLSLGSDPAGQDVLTLGAEILQPSSDLSVPLETISVGKPVVFASAGGRTCYGLYYAPANGEFFAPEGEKPPMIVSAHGGPTGMADRGLKLKIQYWTSRGFAYFDVDYTGSFGYGTDYRRALDGYWGVRDVEDVIAGAQEMAAEGKADKNRLVISGSSAGGYTVLAALVESDVFAAGAAYYGISDMLKLQEATHKFELGYIDTLMGTMPGARNEIFKDRSPVYNVDRMTSPVIFFQGSEDRVVPPEQSRKMAEILSEQAVPVAYIEFPGEAHGFRDAKNIETALKSEYAFYARILNLPVSADLPPVEILNFGDK